MKTPSPAAVVEYLTEQRASRRALTPARIEEIRILAAHHESLDATSGVPVLYSDPPCHHDIANDHGSPARTRRRGKLVDGVLPRGTRSTGKPDSDLVYTDPEFAARIVEHFGPEGFCVDPCRGRGAFYDALPEDKDWCELAEGRDFLDYVPAKPIDWIVTNPPWSAKPYRSVLRRSCELADNVVMVARLDRALAVGQGRHDDFLRYNHHIKEIVVCEFKVAKFLDVEGMPVKSGYPLGIIHWQRGWGNDLLSKEGDGGTTWTYWR